MGLGRFGIGALACGLMLAGVPAQGGQEKKDKDKTKDDAKVVVKGTAVTPEAELPGDSDYRGFGDVGWAGDCL